MTHITALCGGWYYIVTGNTAVKQEPAMRQDIDDTTASSLQYTMNHCGRTLNDDITTVRLT